MIDGCNFTMGAGREGVAEIGDVDPSNIADRRGGLAQVAPVGVDPAVARTRLGPPQ